MAKKETPSTKAEGVGAGNVTLTRDLLITNQLLYQLSYSSKYRGFHAAQPSSRKRTQPGPGTAQFVPIQTATAN